MAMEENGKNTALLIIDMQKDFVTPGSPVCVHGSQSIVPSVIKAVDIARLRGILVVWVVREHDSLGRDVELFRRHMYSGKKTDPLVKGSKGAELVDGLVITGNDYKLVKTRFSAFFGTNLHSFLQAADIKKLVVVGVQTPNCIRQTVFDAVELDYQSVTVIVDATAAGSPEVHVGWTSDGTTTSISAQRLCTAIHLWYKEAALVLKDYKPWTSNGSNRQHQCLKTMHRPLLTKDYALRTCRGTNNYH
ncbi:hypothetical protein C5167_018729 [Papaver somniferum]|uniref:Isochorismatase-like domain-containing protein n=1 Tax=Papaver somniferum TaxID=3469 RepID=A0A4Y7IRG5_PAPSO|nr:hypothetical protein C5167_018729 [Papaver somniferum]